MASWPNQLDHGGSTPSLASARSWLMRPAGASRRLPLADGRTESTKTSAATSTQGVGDHGQQQASAAVANEHHGSGGLCGGGTHGLRYVTPLRRGGAGDPEQ
jgi:hypothetical protein